MSIPIGTDLFVSRARLTSLGMSVPDSNSFTDTEGALGGGAGAIWVATETIGPSTDPTGYIIRHVSTQSGGQPIDPDQPYLWTAIQTFEVGGDAVAFTALGTATSEDPWVGSDTLLFHGKP